MNVWIVVWEMCANHAHCAALKRAALIADKNVYRLELRTLRTVLGYKAGPHVRRHPTALYRILPLMSQHWL